MSEGNEAEIINAEEVPFHGGYQSNKTQQIVNLVSVNQTIQVDKVPDTKKSKLTKESVSSILDFYNEMCVQYGFKVEFNIESITKNFNDIINDDQQRIFEIFLSKGFEKFRLTFFQRAMITISTLMDQVSSPEVLNDQSLSLEYKFGIMQSLVSLMDQVTNLYNQIKVENPELMLKNLANKQSIGDLHEIKTSPETIAVMEQLKKITLKYKEE